MSRVIRVCVMAIGAGLAGVGLLLVALMIFIDPNDYRDDISALAQQHAGVQLKLKGELGWSFYPVLGFKVQGADLAMASGMPTLLEVDALTVGVRLLPLFSKRVEIDALDIAGLKAQLLVDANGKNNWQVPSTPVASTPASTAGANATDASPANTAPANATNGAQPSTSLPVLSIPSLTVRDSSVHYQDKQAKLDYQADIPLLQLHDVSLNEPFPLQLQAHIWDNAKKDITLDLKAVVRADLAAKYFQVNDIELDSILGGVFPKPVKAGMLGQVQFDQQKDSAVIALSRLQLADMRATANIEAMAVSKTPNFKGKIKSEPFDLKSLLAAMGMAVPVTSDPNALSRVQLDVAFAGTPEQIAVKPLQLKLDDSTLSGDVAITDVTKQAMQFNLTLDALDADRYLAPEKSGTSATASATAGASDATPSKSTAAKASSGDLLPVETLRQLNLKGKFSAGEVVINKIALRDITIGIKAKDGDVQLNELNAKALQGTVAGAVGVDVRAAQPRITTRLDVQNLLLQELLAPWVSAPVLSGRSSLHFDTTTQGNDTDTLLRQALGQLDLSLAEGVLHGVNLNQLVVDALKQKLGDFTTLMPDYETRLPKALKGDTNLRDLLANMKVENGHLITPSMKANSDAGQFTATGDVDLVAQGFDYRFGVVLSALDDHKYFKGTEWPIRCRGSLDIPAKDWCRPDMNAMGKVLQQAAQVAVRERATEKLGEKLGIPGASEAEVKTQLQQKAQEKVNEKLSKQFDKWLKRNKKDEAPAAQPLPDAAPSTAPATPVSPTAPTESAPDAASQVPATTTP